ncbi:MAG: hypothetical protein EOM64_08700 [Erysipelotrichia bacterium]|nr:hypothetical protein [Erysipelotrichia bacterium]
MAEDHNNGFASVYFLSVFLSISVITGISIYNSSNRLRAAKNLSETVKYLAQENAVSSKVKCLMKNKELVSGMYESGGFKFDLDVQNGWATAVLNDPLHEIIIYTIQEDKYVIFEMETIRDTALS